MNAIKFVQDKNIKENINKRIISNNINLMMTDRNFILTDEKEDFRKYQKVNSTAITYLIETSKNKKYMDIASIVDVLNVSKSTFANFNNIILVIPLPLNKTSKLLISNPKRAYTSTNNKIYKWISKHSISIEIFLHSELIYNPVRNCLANIYEKLSDEDIVKLCKDLVVYALSKDEKYLYENIYNEKLKIQSVLSRLAVMNTTDKVARYYNFMHGDVIKIIRDDDIVYRVVKKV